MNKFCAFGPLTPQRFGEVLETNERWTKIKPEYGRFEEYWENPWVKIFDTEEEARNETKKWITQDDR